MKFNPRTAVIIAAAAVPLIFNTGCGSQTVSANGPAPTNPPTAAATTTIAPVAHPLTIPKGTIIRVRTESTVSTRTLRSGETIPASLAAPLVIDGFQVGLLGSDATLQVADSNPGGRIKGRAHLGLRLSAVQLGGENKPVRSNIWWRQAHGTKKKDALKIGGIAGAGAAIGGFAAGGVGAAIGAGVGGGVGTGVVLATRGAPAVVRAESILQFSLAEPVTIMIIG